MFCLIARAVQVLQQHMSLLRKDTNAVLPKHTAAQSPAMNWLRGSDLSVAKWLTDLTDFEVALSSDLENVCSISLLALCKCCNGTGEFSGTMRMRCFQSSQLRNRLP